MTTPYWKKPVSLPPAWWEIVIWKEDESPIEIRQRRKRTSWNVVVNIFHNNQLSLRVLATNIWNIVQHSVGHSDLSLSSFNICDSRIKRANKAKWWQREDVTDIKWNLQPSWGLLAAPSVAILSTPIHTGGIPPTLCSIHQKVIYLENTAKIEVINSICPSAGRVAQ